MRVRRDSRWNGIRVPLHARDMIVTFLGGSSVVNIKRKQQAWFYIAFTLILMGGYQNCSNSMSFDGQAINNSKSAFLDPDSDPVVGNPGNPADVMPPDNDDDTDIDYDHNRRKIAFNCSTGARYGWSEAELAAAKDYELKNRFGFLFHISRPVRNVSVESVRGSVAIKNALHTLKFDSVKGALSYLRSLQVDRYSNIEAGISATATLKLTELSNIKAGYTCASGQEIGRISNVQSLFFKVRGRPFRAMDSSLQNNAKAIEISNINATFSSVYRINAALIHNVNGEIIIRNSQIDRLENVQGGITLINSSVTFLKNVNGTVRIKNSSITAEENVVGDRVSLP